MGASRTVKLHPSWLAELESEFDAPYMAELRAFLMAEKRQARVYPPGGEIFAAFDHTPFDAVRVVILGQDPYHGPGQAHGLSFSVRRGVRVPPSLGNIYKELRDDLGVEPARHGDLTAWAERGVLLLNSVLTVRERKPGSHRGKGWETFTDRAIERLATRREGLVFLLWGRAAKEKAAVVDTRRHTVLTAAHPSPYSANNGFFGCRHFSRANDALARAGLPPVDWQLPDA